MIIVIFNKNKFQIRLTLKISINFDKVEKTILL